MQRLFIASIFAFVLILNAVAQVETDGSIVFASWTQNEIVLAADSRQANPQTYQDVR
jgi:hypothetical protein